MKKSSFGLVILLVLAILVSACGNAKTPTGSSAPAPTASVSSAPASEQAGLPDISSYKGADTQFPHSYPEPKPVKDKQFVIGYMNILGSNEQLAAEQNAFVKVAEKLNAKVVVKDDQLDVNKQISDMEQLIAQKVDAIVYYPIDPKAIVRTVQKARDAGIPVFAQDQTASPEEDAGNIVSQVWQGRDTSAYFAAATVAKMKPGAKVVVIGLNVPVPSLMFLTKQIKNYAEQLGLTVVAQKDSEADDASGGQKVMSEVLVNNTDIDAVIAYNDPNAQGAYLALKEKGLENKVITVGFNGGSDAFSAIKAGRQTVSIKYNAVEVARQLAFGVYDYISGQIPKDKMPKVVVVTPTIMTKDNIDTMKTWDEEANNL